MFLFLSTHNENR